MYIITSCSKKGLMLINGCLASGEAEIHKQKLRIQFFNKDDLLF